MPTQDLGEFHVVYYADGFGEIEVIEEEDKLLAIFPTYKFKLELSNNNNFYLKGRKDFKHPFNPEFSVKFLDNVHGEISILKLFSQ